MSNLAMLTGQFTRRTLIFAVSFVVVALMALAFILGRTMTGRINSITLIDSPAVEQVTPATSPELRCPRPGWC
jgi:uncharacterized membrane protein